MAPRGRAVPWLDGLSNLSLRLRVIGLLGLLTLILAGTGLSMALTLHDYNAQRVLIRETLTPAGDASNELLVSLLNQETGERGYLVTGQGSFLGPYRKGRVDFDRALADIEQLLGDEPEVRAELDAVSAAVGTWREVAAEPEIAARRTGDVEGARRLVAGGQGRAAFDEVRAATEALRQSVQGRLGTERTAAASAFEQLTNLLVLAALLLVALVVATALLMRRWVLLPVGDLRANMRAVALGQLDRRVLVTGPPEVEAIAADAEGMRQRIISELEAARAATEALHQHSPVVSGLRNELSARSVDELDGVRVHGVLHPAEGVLAGDWWETVRRDSGRTTLLVADVAGHGAEAGLVALRFKQRITVLLRTDLDLLTAFVTAAKDLDDDDERFLSCVLVEVDAEAGKVRWINAGHSAAMILHRQGADTIAEDLYPTGPLIGALEHRWEVQETTLGAGDLLIAMTDGITEARRGGDTEFGVEGVLATLSGMQRWSPRSCVAELGEAVRTFADDWRRDDVTIVALDLVLEREPTGVPA